MRFRGATKGVSKIFAAEIMILFASVIACVLYALITIAGDIDSINLEGEPDSSVIAIVVCSIAVGVLILLAGLFKIIGYIQAARDEEYFVRAIIFAIIAIVLYAVSGFLQTKTGGVMGWVNTIVLAIAELLQLLVITSTINGIAELAYDCRRDDVVNRGGTINKIIGTVFSLNISMIILGHVFKLFMNETTITTISTIVAVIILVLTVIAYILYLGYLGKASRMLKNER